LFETVLVIFWGVL